MPHRTIRAFCPHCRHQQPFVRARFEWKLHILMTVLTVGVWAVCLISAAVKRVIWPWRCEHCGWHEPDFRSPEERAAGLPKVKPRAGMTESGRFRIKGMPSPSPSSVNRPPRA